MKLKLAAVSLIAALVLTGAFVVRSQDAALPRFPSAPDAAVYFISPYDGETVGQTFTVRFGLRGMGIAPAGIPFENSGHHHMLVDVPQSEMPPMVGAMPATDNILHFGKGQTETELTLPPGTHTLQLVFADLAHQPHDPPVISRRITVNVK